MYDLWVFLHLAGVLGFLAAHGASGAAGLRLRRERNPERVRALLDLSASTRRFGFGSLALLLLGGVAAGVDGGWWGQGWITAALLLLALLVAAALPLAVPYYRAVRQAAAAGARERLDELLGSARPLLLAVVETGGILVILWLMVAKPF
ncbi:MAG TPA: DUF2269 family protein [Actinomycetes bacterium]|nr:DUF2269 family protein [Actinomycetes bacterium]